MFYEIKNTDDAKMLINLNNVSHILDATDYYMISLSGIMIDIPIQEYDKMLVHLAKLKIVL
jgi:hypothetical protein